jgi:hypothetical protein
MGAEAHDELLERQHELAVLDDLVDRVHRGNMALALIVGPAGIGKSRLLRAVRERARSAGFRTLAARGSNLERGLPFGVVRQLFEPALAEPGRRDQWLSGSAAAAARVFDPAEVGNPAADAGLAGIARCARSPAGRPERIRRRAGHRVCVAFESAERADAFMASPNLSDAILEAGSERRPEI